MNPTQRGYYIQLLAEAWDNTPIGHLPNEPEILRSLAGEQDIVTWKNNHGLVLEQFKVRGKKIYNPRLVEERRKQEENKMRGRKGGTTSANHRKEKHLGSNQTSSQGQAAGTENVEAKTNPSSSIASSISSSTSTSPAVVKTKGPARAARGQIELPEWVPVKEFEAYVDMRRKIRKPMTDQAIKLAISKLENLNSRGHPPVEVLNQSIEHSWNGLFEIKQDGNGAGNGSGQRPSREANRIARNRAAIVSGLPRESGGANAGHYEPDAK